MKFVVRVLAGIGFLTLVLVALLFVAASKLQLGKRPVPPLHDGTILTLSVEGPFPEESPARSGVASLVGGHPKKLREIIGALDHATTDPRVRGLVLKLDESPGMAQVQEIRAALERFRGAGKFVYGYADDFGSGSGNGQYYLASACDQIWLQPLGEVVLADVAFESPFLKNAFDKFGVTAEFVKRSEYKTAPETFTEAGFSPAAREMMESLANDLTQQMIGDVAASRSIAPDAVRAAISKGPLAADEAVAAKFVDKVGYADELIAEAKRKAGGAGALVPVLNYYAQTVTPPAHPVNIALIYEIGDIDRDRGGIDPLGPDHGVDQQSAVLEGLARAAAAPSVKAIVLRVNSPGGSVSGSESLRRMIVRAKQSGKKIVVSMGSMAASGGYWISADADKIVAEPATLTGSIGVFSGKFVVGKALADIGVNVDRTSAGPFAQMDSPLRSFTAEQSQKLNESVDRVYQGFLDRVAEGRKLPVGAVAQSAKGRVWTGQQARQLGLVDSLGGLDEAIRVARDLSGIKQDEPTSLGVYPEPLSPLEAVRAIFSGDAGIEGEAQAALRNVQGTGGLILRSLLQLDQSRARYEAVAPGIAAP